LTVGDADISASLDNGVHVVYYDCTTGAQQNVLVTVAGFYPNYDCNRHAAGAPSVYILDASGNQQIPSMSSVAITLVCCDLLPSVTPTSSVTPSVTPSVTSSVTPSVTSSVTPSITLSVTPSVTPSITPSSSLGAPCVHDTVTPKGIKISFNSGSNYTNCTVYTGITSTNITGVTSCTGMTTGDICEITGITATLLEMYVRIDCEGCCEQVFRVNLDECCDYITPSPTPSITTSVTPTPSITTSVTSTPTPTPTPSITTSVTSTPTPTPTPSITTSVTSTPTPTPTPTPTNLEIL